MATDPALNYVRGATEAQRYYLDAVVSVAVQNERRRREAEPWKCVRCGIEMGLDPALFCKACLWR